MKVCGVWVLLSKSQSSEILPCFSSPQSSLLNPALGCCIDNPFAQGFPEGRAASRVEWREGVRVLPVNC